MGWCREFGPQIEDGCSHPMVAEAACCTCRECGTICRGRFNGCPTVWASVTTMTPLHEVKPLNKRPKHRAKEAARTRTVVLPPEPAASAAAVASAPLAPRAAPPPPRGLADIRQRLEGLRGRMKALEGGLQESDPGAPEAIDFR